ncbi:4-oxalomesaconate tautomerase [Chelativorans salis]|uniref:4-oxalomesaconate tautomerase n=1 Tax=Chelativorans salis TaxID=2978478 RepID=A0ABT2LVG7_9HYPH|nr:4-oxalomesaconate tautomerase [Chelativorans sp. EGI FJ00035]MCT7378376.1 4-oxalomesaconate tautomerase [Chelativorans sp. EGI FJ00035]
MSEGIRAMWMRGGTSKGGYFLAADLPQDVKTRDGTLLGIMGSPDPRQIDGLGGADPLTSKVAVVRPSEREGVDVDYLFLQVFVDQAIVTDSQNCGNILAGVGPFAIERGLVKARAERTEVRIFMENTRQIAVATVETPGGRVNYAGETRIDGVPGSAASIPIVFEDTAGSTCGALLPSGRAADTVDGVEVTLIDNGMPCVVLGAADFGIRGDEAPAELEANAVLRERVEAIRLKAGPMMNLGDVREKSVPKMTLVSPPRHGGMISTRTFIPHRCHAAIGVLGAVSVATACLLPEGPAARHAKVPEGSTKTMSVEHPTGEFTVIANLDEAGNVQSTGVLRTARKLADGVVFA